MVTKKVKTTESDTLAFAKAINRLTQAHDEIKSSLDSLENLKAETLNEIQLELKSKREELTNLEKEYDVKRKDFEIQIEQEFKEF